MAITGYLSEFSLPEVFQFLDRGKKTGLLNLISSPDPQTGQQQNYYIWFRQGRIVAAANCLDNQVLLSLIRKKGWMTDTFAAKIKEESQLQKPIGLWLKSQGLLEAEQLQLLFYIQVMRQVCSLFTLEDASFKFNTQASLPMLEMTGLSTPGVEITLAGLRALRDWKELEDKLPQTTSGLIGIVRDNSSLKLNQSEWQVWEFSNGTVSLEKIAKQLNLSVSKVQQIAFRLITVGLAEEAPMVATSTNTTNSFAEVGLESEDTQSHSDSQNAVSKSFLKNLLGFLRAKA